MPVIKNSADLIRNYIEISYFCINENKNTVLIYRFLYSRRDWINILSKEQE